ncbi:bleomycin resistance protein [Bryobacter aggregatus]|uniref:bleomycin resistance protein n=1 Tax=Bryobacter aggregatus TaxID=360054 RepID=UPI0004E27A19|nr:VOC family protein [Bryobacter aggregatus]
MFQSTIPVLPSLNLDETVGFYTRIGFQVWSRHDDDYAILGREGSEMHFFLMQHLIPSESFFGCYWKVSDAVALHAEFTGLGLTNLHPIEEKPWGMREFALIDPHGNLIRVGQEIE